MRKFLLGAAAIIAVVAPSAALAQTGYVGATLGSLKADGGDEAETYGVEGAVAFGGSNSIGFELDASYTDSDDSDGAYGLLGHVYGRNDSHLFGGFVGISGTDESETWTAGLEAAKYFTNWTLAGAVTYGNNDDAEIDGYGANVEGRFFLSDNFRLNANVGFATLDDGTDEADALVYGLGGEYQFSAIPISLALGFSTVDSDGPEVESLGLAVRYNWGGSLRDRDRTGASQASSSGLGSAFAGPL